MSALIAASVKRSSLRPNDLRACGPETSSCEHIRDVLSLMSMPSECPSPNSQASMSHGVAKARQLREMDSC